MLNYPSPLISEDNLLGTVGACPVQMHTSAFFNNDILKKTCWVSHSAILLTHVLPGYMYLNKLSQHHFTETIHLEVLYFSCPFRKWYISTPSREYFIVSSRRYTSIKVCVHMKCLLLMRMEVNRL